MVCEVIEGDIIQVEVKFENKLGNVVEGNTKLPVIQRELPKQVALTTAMLAHLNCSFSLY